ncbi:hypothetical protein [Hyphomonas atlantica]|uniref:Uncharacterized protein n=1 Tax=Hyphomonas atlantica TaxID=1280948 RepID=A0A059E371_9PROT|nr:hypothetical protein [Hyphomonas atlantica]KCZ62040.1 hypothetical protein HY36_16250 [Hyphomonas atlantica]
MAKNLLGDDLLGLQTAKSDRQQIGRLFLKPDITKPLIDPKDPTPQLDLSEGAKEPYYISVSELTILKLICNRVL